MAHNYVDGVTDVCINWDDVDGEYCAGSVFDKIIGISSVGPVNAKNNSKMCMCTV